MNIIEILKDIYKKFTKDIEKLFKNIEAIMNIEGFSIDNEEKNLIFQYLNSEITEEMGVEYIKSKYK